MNNLNFVSNLTSPFLCNLIYAQVSGIRTQMSSKVHYSAYYITPSAPLITIYISHAKYTHPISTFPFSIIIATQSLNSHLNSSAQNPKFSSSKSAMGDSLSLMHLGIKFFSIYRHVYFIFIFCSQNTMVGQAQDTIIDISIQMGIKVKKKGVSGFKQFQNLAITFQGLGIIFGGLKLHPLDLRFCFLT